MKTETFSQSIHDAYLTFHSAIYDLYIAQVRKELKKRGLQTNCGFYGAFEDCFQRVVEKFQDLEDIQEIIRDHAFIDSQTYQERLNGEID